MMDLALLDTATGSEEGRWFEPVNLAGQKVGIKIKVYGPDSRKYSALRDEMQREVYRALSTASNGLEVKPDNRSEAEREAAFYAALTIDWQPLDPSDPVTFEGNPFPFTKENAELFYLKAASIRAQVKAHTESRRHFTRPDVEGLKAPCAPTSTSTGRAKKGR